MKKLRFEKKAFLKCLKWMGFSRFMNLSELSTVLPLKDNLQFSLRPLWRDWAKYKDKYQWI